MEYEWTIMCLGCGCVKSQGGFTVAQTLVDNQVLQNAEHNPGCLIPTAPSLITSAPDSLNANVMRYTINRQVGV